ncbi:MAG: glycosyltransferase family 39 protein [Candidatus Omnitrophica bacterium]|nr:glycosyltransferase family 39 protein [Candidatus Omnitrophota bacterium]MCF7876720.1 glycosyltransferase family 39 protein [Candidatus Omnitrophota bacterium]MCF7891453.1 glycosyltransferase family 39 protein [Candidatus Omnitrophota bacterium]MCF7895389.1 glycosyltransferase family 39 protein [Candidatus Omnitrophota bacterium]MCF7897175.1 glycosyltransferase family 39 protein [Candidatus Omnitrophota bacterium]
MHKWLYRYRRPLILFFLLVAFALRYYGAVSIPPVWDEVYNEFPDARRISFSKGNINIPIVDTTPEGGVMLPKYVIYLGWTIFGNSLIGARLPFILSGVFLVLLIYLIVKKYIGIEAALISALLASISQYCVGASRWSDSQSLSMIIALVSLFVFYRALLDSNKYMILLNGLLIGIACWFYENLIFLIPIYIIFLLVCPKYRSWLKSKYLWWSFVIALFAAAPLVVMTLNSGAERFKYIYAETAVGLSLNAIGLYLGELILLVIKNFPDLFEFVAKSLDSEAPPANFLFGIIILVSVVRSFKSKQPFIRLLVVWFMFNFIVFSFLRRNDVIQSIWSLGSLDWGSLGFMAGLILAANQLYLIAKKKDKRGAAIFIILVTFILFKTWDFVSYPLNSYFPVREYLLKTAHFGDVAYLKSAGKTEDAKEILKRIYKLAKNKRTKYRAAWELANILKSEGKNQEAEEYLSIIQRGS